MDFSKPQNPLWFRTLYRGPAHMCSGIFFLPPPSSHLCRKRSHFCRKRSHFCSACKIARRAPVKLDVTVMQQS